MLYNIPPDTTLPTLKSSYGEPNVRIPFEDGWVALAYQFKGHNVIVETAPDDPEYIIAVQIAGDSNPPGKGLLGVNLGDNFKEALRAFGLPESRRPSIDEKTREPIQEAWIYQYNAASFEVVQEIITSIKIHYPSRKKSPANEVPSKGI